MNKKRNIGHSLDLGNPTIRDPGYMKRAGDRALALAKEQRKGKKYKLVQIGPKSWKEEEINEGTEDN
ncbi:MAG: hypothetical protein DRI46_11110, partial [Chloroflexi bacterium]